MNTGRYRLAAGLFLVLTAVLQLASLILVKDDFTRKLLSNLFQALSSLFSAVLLLFAVIRLQRDKDPSTRGWTLITIASFFFALGMAGFMFVEIVMKIPPYPGYPDILFYLFYPLMAAGLWLLPRDRLDKKELWNCILDVTSLAVVASLFIWHFNLRMLIEALLVNPEPDVIASLFYTLLDTILLLLVFFMLTRKLGRGRQFTSMLFLVFGNFSLITADLLQGYMSTLSSFQSGSLVDLGWVLFSVLSGFAALNLLRNDPQRPPTMVEVKNQELFRDIWTMVITYFWIFLVFLLLIWGFYNRDQVNPVFLIAGVAAALVLAVTKQIKTLLENNRLNASLRKANEDLASFGYTVSHDLRAPLRAIHGFSMMIREAMGGRLEQESSSLLETVIQNSERMGGLIDELLIFSRAGTQEIHRVRIPMAQAFEEAWQEVLVNNPPVSRPEYRQYPMPFEAADPVLLRQVLVNLLSNALKYSSRSPKPVIETGFNYTRGKRVYYVKDNGVGFDMNYASKLFQVFQRLHTDRDFPGTGAGLAIVKRILERHGGDIWAESSVDQGAVFYFTLG